MGGQATLCFVDVCMIPRRSTRETLLSMTYGSEALIPTKTGFQR